MLVFANNSLGAALLERPETNAESERLRYSFATPDNKLLTSAFSIYVDL